MTGTLSASAKDALAYLKRKKPLSGWGVEVQGGYRLLRRSVPLTDNKFLDIHYDPTHDCVVGILKAPRNGATHAQVLVDSDGSPVGSKTTLVTIRSYDPLAQSSSTRSASSTSTTTTSAADNQQLIQYGLAFFGVCMILTILSRAMYVLSLLLVPCVYLYAVQTCPSERSFDAKKELKRVLRGHHLPEDHPDKPKNFLDRTFAKISATVTTELATGLGYEVTMMSLANAGWFTTVKVPAAQTEAFWLGAFSKWVYIGSRSLER